MHKEISEEDEYDGGDERERRLLGSVKQIFQKLGFMLPAATAALTDDCSFKKFTKGKIHLCPWKFNFFSFIP